MGLVRKLLILAVVVVVARNFLPGSEEPDSPVISREQATQKPRGWDYLEPLDDLSGKAYKYARVRSINSLSLNSPYSGINHGTLIVRQHPQHGLGVLVTIDKGQILCRGESYWDCAFQIRFDDGPVEKFSALRAADGSSTVIFSKYPKWALGKIKSAKTIKVELLIYKAGNQTLTFNVDEPLDW